MNRLKKELIEVIQHQTKEEGRKRERKRGDMTVVSPQVQTRAHLLHHRLKNERNAKERRRRGKEQSEGKQTYPIRRKMKHQNSFS